MPLQQNDFDSGIFVCQYIHALVEACFEGAENGVRFSMSPLAYRRGLREDVCALAEGRLIGELTAAGHEIPRGNEIRKPHDPDVIGDEVEDREWRAEMAERMHRLEHDGAAVGEGRGDVAADGGPVAVMGALNADTHDSIRGAHGEVPVADVEMGEGVNVSVREGGGEGVMADGAKRDNEKVGVRDAGAGGLMGITDGNRGAAEAVGTGHGVTASNVDVDLVSARSAGTETTSRNTARGRAPSSGYTGVSKREGKWAARLCIDSTNNTFLALGRYTNILDAATAYAAAAYICRPSLFSSKVVELSEEDRRCLDGLTPQGVERIVDAKRWPEWRNWRVVLSSLPEPSTPAPAGVHTQSTPPFPHQHPGASCSNYPQPTAAFAGHVVAYIRPGGWQPYTQSHPPSNLHYPSQQYAFNQIPIHPFGQVQAHLSVYTQHVQYPTLQALLQHKTQHPFGMSYPHHQSLHPTRHILLLTHKPNKFRPLTKLRRPG
ncbi:unnamed protein product [Closterium sp. Yama58-4]|nr:unnamed protein product [Closterium sp. Yama58-4]